jgi:hypothetical protein
LEVADRPVQLAKFKLALTELTDEPADALACAYVTAVIGRLEVMVETDTNLEAEMAADAQETLNEKVCRRVCARLMDLYLPQIRSANTAESKIALREKMRKQKKSVMLKAKLPGLDKSGAEISVVAKAVADALEKMIANALYSGTKDPLPTDTLENIQSRIDQANAAQEWLEKAEAERRAYWQELKEQNPKQFEKESKSLVLQIKGDGHFANTQRKSMAALKRSDPQEYERRALEALKPRNVVPQQIIYVAMEGKREIFYWPDGRLVKRGEEITFDFRLRRWCLMPGPAGTELETPLARQKMELNQHDDGSFHWEPEGSQGVWEQQNDGTFKRTDSGASPWTRVERIQFVRAETPASAAHTEMRHGKWFTPEEVQKAAEADAANPPQLLPPLPKYAVSDSLALPPPTTARDREKDSKEPSVWKRWEIKQREDKAREAALLQGN